MLSERIDSSHLSVRKLRRFAKSSAAVAKNRHLGECVACRALLRLYSGVFARTSSQPECLDLPTLNLLASGPVAHPRLAELESHLTACIDCVLELEARVRVVRAQAAGTKLANTKAMTLKQRLAALLPFTPPLLPECQLNSQGSAPFRHDPELEAAFSAFRETRHDEARRRLEQLRLRGMRSAQADFTLGVCRLLAGKEHEAVTVLADASRAEPTNLEYRWYLAQALIGAGEESQGVREAEQVAKANGAYAEAARTAVSLAGEASTGRSGN